MKTLFTLFTTLVMFILIGCKSDSQEAIDSSNVQEQQKQYSHAQPVPKYGWSLERDLLIQIYNIRNYKAATHTVWRGDTSVIEGDCASIGYGLPYDTSLTNPLTATDVNQRGREQAEGALTSIGQAEPNGVFASTNTNATWVMCVGESGLEPHYVESKVTGYPYPVKVDYDTNRVYKSGKSSVSIKISK